MRLIGVSLEERVLNFSDVIGVGVAHGNAAHIDSPFNFEETIVAPVGSPRVLHQPVVHAVFSAVANCQHGVVHVSLSIFARAARVHARRVRTEVVDDLEGHRDRLLVNGTFKFDFIAGGDVH